MASGTSFCGGADLDIEDKAGSRAASSSALGMTYKCPSGENDCDDYMAPVKFKVADYEVYTFSLESSLPPVR